MVDEFVFAGTRQAPQTKPVGLISLTQELGQFLAAPREGEAHVVSSPAGVRRLAEPARGRRPHPTPQYGRDYGSWDAFPVRDRDFSTTDWKDWGKPRSARPSMTSRVIETILDKATAMGLFSDDDWDATSVTDMNELEYWRGFFLQKARSIKELNDMIAAVARPASTPSAEKLLR